MGATTVEAQKGTNENDVKVAEANARAMHDLILMIGGGTDDLKKIVNQHVPGAETVSGHCNKSSGGMKV